MISDTPAATSVVEPVTSGTYTKPGRRRLGAWPAPSGGSRLDKAHKAPSIADAAMTT